MPQISGLITQNETNTNVKVNMKLKGLDAALLFLLTIILILIAVTSIYSAFTHASIRSSQLGGFAACIGIYGIIILRYNLTLRKVKKEFSQFFQAATKD